MRRQMNYPSVRKIGVVRSVLLRVAVFLFLARSNWRYFKLTRLGRHSMHIRRCAHCQKFIGLTWRNAHEMIEFCSKECEGDWIPF